MPWFYCVSKRKFCCVYFCAVILLYYIFDAGRGDMQCWNVMHQSNESMDVDTFFMFVIVIFWKQLYTLILIIIFYVSATSLLHSVLDLRVCLYILSILTICYQLHYLLLHTADCLMCMRSLNDTRVRFTRGERD